MTQQQLDERENEAWEAFLTADWSTADARLDDWLDAYREATRPGGRPSPSRRSAGRSRPWREASRPTRRHG